jgi:hypothetical protein
MVDGTAKSKLAMIGARPRVAAATEVITAASPRAMALSPALAEFTELSPHVARPPLPKAPRCHRTSLPVSPVLSGRDQASLFSSGAPHPMGKAIEAQGIMLLWQFCDQY